MTSYTLQVQPQTQYTIEYSNQRGPQGAAGSDASATTDASLLVSGTLAVTVGGTGLNALGSALQVLRVNAGGTALEYGTVSGGGAWGSITGTLSSQTDLQAALDAKASTSAVAAGYQPLDSDLTAIAALTTTSTGRALLTESVSQTGTGALVRAAGPTLTGTTSVANLTASGTVTAQNSIRVGTAVSNSPYIFPFDAATHTSLNAGGRGLTFYSYVIAAGSTSIAFSGDPNSQTSGTNTHLLVQRTFQPTSGTGTYSLATITTTINQTGGANGITRGLFINPTLTAAADFRGIEVGNCGSQTAIRTGTGLVSFGDSVSITGTTRLGTYTVGTLPSAASNTRARAFVTDSNQTFNSANLGATVTAGGAILVPVFSDGTNWVIG